MDAITAQVRALYEKYPYPPPGPPILEQGSDVRWLLSRVAQTRAGDGPLWALDAGCGRGRGLLASATLQPDVRFVGIDISRVSLAAAREEARKRGLQNVWFHEVDLMTLEGLHPPKGGFDVIYAAGVIHHLSDPEAGLRRLAEHLAPHGVMVFMVYSELGRAPVRRLSEAISELLPPNIGLEDRVRVGRGLVAALSREGGGDAVRQGPWADVDQLDDVEFVDRYLHPSERYYTVDQVHTLAESAGLQVLSWVNPAPWSLPDRMPPGPLRQLAARLPPRAQWRIVERLYWERTFELLLTHPGNRPAPPPSQSGLQAATLRRNPEASLAVRRRATAAGPRVETVSLHVGSADPRPILGPVARAAVVVDETVMDGRSVPAEALLARFEDEPDLAAVGLQALHMLVQLGFLYVPNPGA